MLPLNPELYPDVVAAGGLLAALESVAGELGLDLGPLQMDAGNPLRTVLVASLAPDREPAQVSLLEAEVRWFTLFGRWQGVDLLNGDDDDLAPIVRGAEAWRRGATLREIKQVCPNIDVTELLEAHERGPAEAVAQAWRGLLEWLREKVDEFVFARPTLAVAEAAFAEPVLRRLYPVTGHWKLDFLSNTGSPAAFNVPSVLPMESGRYRIQRPDRGTPFGGAVIGDVDTAEEAIALVMAHVPPGLGPATAGPAVEG